MRFAVTTPLEPSPPTLGAARAAAERWRAPFLERRGRSLAELARSEAVAALLVVSTDRAALWRVGRTAVWTQGLGALRSKRLRTGEAATRDGFLDAARLRNGDVVVDCTLGLGADALVAAQAVGPSGRVVGLESSEPLAALTSEGLRALSDPVARRVEVVHADAAEWLARAPDASADVVVFDPMFRTARGQPPGFELVRELADARPLEASTLRDAVRVARRSVLVKDGAPGLDLLRLGLTPLPHSRWVTRVYARIDR